MVGGENWKCVCVILNLLCIIDMKNIVNDIDIKTDITFSL